MSLVAYRDAVPWAESIRAEVVSGHMPPYYVEQLGSAQLKDSHRLSSRELDILLTWATGGTPEGPRTALPPVRSAKDWKLGRPDVSLPLPSPFTLAADKMEDTHEFVLQAGDEDRWVRAADLLPGNASIVHDALIYTRDADGQARAMLALWLPGSDPVATPPGTGFHWPAGSSVAVRIHYQKTWTLEGKESTDLSTVGLYFAKAPVREVESLAIGSTPLILAENRQILAVRTNTTTPDVELSLSVTRPNGSKTPVLALTPRPHWDRRYWLASPLSIPRGTRIEVGVPDGSRAAEAPRLWLDVMSVQSAAPSAQ